MADIPRDPRQLARDILAGKVRIEDLQRERQARGGGSPPGPRTPEKIPLPRPAQARPQQRPQTPVQRPPAQRQVPQQKPAQQRPAPVRQAPQAPRPPVRQVPIPEPPRPPAPPVMQAAQAYSPQAESTKAPRGLRLNDLVQSKRALRQGILLAEVLGKPISLRDDG
jgi:hypothetical protein